MLLPTKPLIFLASTAAKAWEPLSVAVASSTAGTASTGTPYLFPTALIVCEALKLTALLPMLCFERGRGSLAASGTGVKRRSGSRRSAVYRSAMVYGTPAVALTICNLCLGHAVPRLGALLYQVVFQVATVLTTAGLAWALLGQRLASGQWGALALLTLGSLNVVRAGGGGGASASNPSLSSILVAVAGAAAFSLSTVLSERAARQAPPEDSLLQQAVDFSLWALGATIVALLSLHGGALLSGELSPRAALSGFFHRAQRGPWVVAISIALADLTMTIFCMVDGLGANAYSVSRALSMVATPLLAMAVLGSRVSAEFALASAVVAAGGYLFQRYRVAEKSE